MSYYQKYMKYKLKYLRAKGGALTPSDKLEGCLYGHLVGDALGSRYIFNSSKHATENVKKDTVQNKLPILGSGHFNLKKGQGTDNTEMMLCLLDVVSDNTYNQEKSAKNYIEWYKTKPVDISGSVRAALDTQDLVAKNAKDMIRNSEKMNKWAMSNAVLVRIAPLALISGTLEVEELKDFVDQESDLTHPNSIVKNMALCYCLAIKYCLRGYNKDKVFERVLNYPGILPRTKITLLDAKEDGDKIYLIDEDLNETYITSDDTSHQGYCGVAFQNAFYELMNGNSFNESMVSIIKRGGDTGTNCAITGALLGAYYGLKQIDEGWLKTVKEAKVDRYKKYPYLDPNKVIPENVKKN